MLMRLNLVLTALLVLSCAWLIRTSHESRGWFAELEKAQSDARELQIDADRLQVEIRAQATSVRVERLARERLHMQPTGPAWTDYVGDTPAPATAAPLSMGAGARP